MVLRQLTLLIVLLTLSLTTNEIDARSVDGLGVRSDVIETKYVPDPMETKNVFRQDSYDADAASDIENAKKPGWMVRTFNKIKHVFRRKNNENVDNTNDNDYNDDNNQNNEINQIDNESNSENVKKTQLMRFGAITSRVSNSLGGSAMRVAGVIEKLCKMLKTVIPIVAAVCNVGQFKFCMSADAPLELGEAMNRPIDLNLPD